MAMRGLAKSQIVGSIPAYCTDTVTEWLRWRIATPFFAGSIPVSVSMDKERIKKHALDRENIHKNHKSSRPLSINYEYIGLLGEYQFAVEFGFDVDEELRPEGDRGKDFISPLGKIDVKTARKAYNLIVEVGKVDSDIFVLAQYFDESDKVKLLGWATREEVLDAPSKDFGYGIINHYIPKRGLKPISELKDALVSE
jgi:hypothetical protein